MKQMGEISEEATMVPEPSLTLPPHAAVVSMQWMNYWFSLRWFIAWGLTIAVGAAGVGSAIGAGMLVARYIYQPAQATTTEIVASMVFFMALIVAGIARVWTWYGRSLFDRKIAMLAPDAPQAAYYRARKRQQGNISMIRPATRAAWVAEARSTGIYTWVDERSVGAIAALPLTDRPIEPERVATFYQQYESNFGFIAAAMGAYQLAFGNWAPGITWMFIAFVMGLRLLMRGGLFEPVVAGQGWVQHGKARWTVNDSVVEIRKRMGKSVWVRIVGPAGVTTLNLSHKAKADDSLRDFWQRWMHPAPRLDQEAFDA